MSTQLIESHKKDADICTDRTLCKIKYGEILSRMNLPKGLLGMDNMTEVGYNHTTGFLWAKQNNWREHKFNANGLTVFYNREVSAFIEDRRMTKVKGVKRKELLNWITVSEFYIQEPNFDKITFASTSGLHRTFPVSAFEEEEKAYKKASL